MNIQDFKIFYDLVYYNSFSRAANANKVSQSAVSQTIRRLEKDLDRQLVNRSVRPFNLTPAGHRFYNGCKRLLNLYESVLTEVMVSDDEIVGVVRVGAIYSVGIIELNQLIQHFIRLHPGAKIRLSYLRPNLIYDALEREELDLGVVSYPTAQPGLAAQLWRNERMGVVCHPEHPLALKSRIAARDLEGERMITYDPDLEIRKQIDKWLEKHSVKTIVGMEFDNIENIKQAVEIKAGIAILPLPTVERDIHHRYLAMVPLEEDDLVRPVAVVYPRRLKLSLAAQSFVDYLMESQTAGRTQTPGAFTAAR